MSEPELRQVAVFKTEADAKVRMDAVGDAVSKLLKDSGVAGAVLIFGALYDGPNSDMLRTSISVCGSVSVSENLVDLYIRQETVTPAAPRGDHVH